MLASASFTPRLTILFYDGHYDKAYGSVLPSGKGHVAGVIPSHLVRAPSLHAVKEAAGIGDLECNEQMSLFHFIRLFSNC